MPAWHFRDQPAGAGHVPWTEREVQQVHSHLREHGTEWNRYCLGVTDDHVAARLTRVLPETAAWAATLRRGSLPWSRG
jgi:hypothetical protein